MSLTLKLLTIISLLSINTLAKDTKILDELVIKYEKKRISTTSRFELKETSVYIRKDLPLKGWTGYVLKLKFDINGKDVKMKDILYTNGIVISSELKTLNNKSFKKYLLPDIPNSYYNDEHFIAGNKNAKNKILIFSDPLCPFCLDLIPEVLEHVKKHSNNIALYYYHFPLLQLHPASNTITKAMILAHKQGVKDIVSKIYLAKFEDSFKATESNPTKILKAINKVLNTNITDEQIQSTTINKQLLQDRDMADDMLIDGTPAIYINGKVDKTRRKYKNIK